MRVLVSAYTGLGNFILKTPMIRKIKELWPHAEIDLIAGNGYGTEFVLEGSGMINETHILKPDASFALKLGLFLSLRKKRYDAVFLPFDAAPEFLMLGALLIGGTKYAHINLKQNKNIKQKVRNLFHLFFLPGFCFVPWLQGRHEIDLNYDLLEAFHNRPMERTYHTVVARKDDPEVFRRFDIKAGSYIVIQPSAANGSSTAKVWAPDNFEALVQRIQKKYPDMKVLFVGDRGDLDSIKQTTLADIEGVVNTMGRTSIAELNAIIGNAAMVVAHDSGVMHVANALDTRLIALYGPTDHTRTRPLGENSRILFSGNNCLAAHYTHYISESDLAVQYPGYKCMEAISVDDVMDEIEVLLQQ